MSTRVAAIDCGTNSIRLLIADRSASGALTDIVRRMEVVRLGYGVDRTRRIDPDAMARTLTVVQDYATLCSELGVARARFVATSASRDAENAGEFVTGVQKRFRDLDLTPEVISGDEEAQLSLRGATGDLIAHQIAGPYLVVDLGGGSTELVRGYEAPQSAYSMNIGCVRLTERHLRDDPPTAAQIAAATTDITAALDDAELTVDLHGIPTVVGLAGTITTVTAHALGLAAYDAGAIHLSDLSVTDHLASCESLLTARRQQRAALGFMHQGRVDVIGAGALIWQHILRRVQDRSPELRVITSEHDILDGIALSC